MAKKKLARFAEILKFNNVVQAGVEEVFNRRHRLYGKWSDDFFGRNRPIIVELGCGKGEYSVGMASMFPDWNFIGVDIKGARLWKGAKYSYSNKMQNVAFIRTRIEFISSFFARDEVDGIWLTFPDPQLKKARKRLTSPAFLNRYRSFLKAGQPVHLKTDSSELYEYTLSVIRSNSLELLENTTDLYGSGLTDKVLSIKTFYEQQFLDRGKPIFYLKFRLDTPGEISEPDAR